MYVTSGETKRDKQRHKRRDKQRHNVTSEQDKQCHKRTPHRSGRPSLGFYFFYRLVNLGCCREKQLCGTAPSFDSFWWLVLRCLARWRFQNYACVLQAFNIRPYSKFGHLRHPCSGYAGAFLGGCHRLGLLIFAPCPKQITKRHVGASCSSTVRHWIGASANAWSQAAGRTGPLRTELFQWRRKGKIRGIYYTWPPPSALSNVILGRPKQRKPHTPMRNKPMRFSVVHLRRTCTSKPCSHQSRQQELGELAEI